MFEIRKDVPKPSVSRSAGVAKYPFGEMQPGDSFILADVADTKAKRRAASAINLAHKRYPGRRFSQRVDSQGRLGVWRDAVEDQLPLTL